VGCGVGAVCVCSQDAVSTFALDFPLQHSEEHAGPVERIEHMLVAVARASERDDCGIYLAGAKGL
jgi:uncharacterized protein (DUF1499 family)